jgi:hypothetical protein
MGGVGKKKLVPRTWMWETCLQGNTYGWGWKKKLVPRTWTWETCLQGNTYWGRTRGALVEMDLREEICTYCIGTIGIWLALCLIALAKWTFCDANTQRWGHKHWPKNPLSSLRYLRHTLLRTNISLFPSCVPTFASHAKVGHKHWPKNP